MYVLIYVCICVLKVRVCINTHMYFRAVSKGSGSRVGRRSLEGLGSVSGSD